MSSFERISSKDVLGSNIECITLTKQFFENKIIDNSKEGLPFSFSEFEGLPIQYMQQIHGASIETIKEFSKEPIKETDALFSRSNKFSLAIMSADCLPIAISNSKGTKIALLHAGWRGLSGGIIKNSLAKFDLERDEIKAWLAPCISKEQYEVGSDVFKTFINSDGDSEKNFVRLNSKKWKCG